MSESIEQYRKEIFDLTEALTASAQWIGAERWKRFCRTSLGLEWRDRSPSPEFFRHAERIFRAGFSDGYAGHRCAFDSPGFDLSGYMQESWCEYAHDDEGDYVGNTASPEPMDTVPYREARLIYFIGEQEAVTVLTESRALAPE